MFCIIKIKSETNSHHSEESMSAQNRKSCNTAIRSACQRRMRRARRSSSAAVTGCAASPCSSGSAQPRAPACGRARAGCASGRGRPRVARPSARAPHGRRGPPAGGFGHPKHRTYSARPSGCWSSRIGSRSGCGRCVDKIPYRIGTKYCISVVRCEDFGHGQNNAILPIGAPARLDTASGCFELPESGVCE